MTVEHRTGDLFAQPDLRALMQGVNCQGQMGKGIAPVFKRYWPDMYAEYRYLCLSGQFHVGDLHAWQTAKGNWIYNLATQHTIGRDARLDALETSLAKALDHAAAHDIPVVGTPRIGAGIGGLAWPDVRKVLHRLADPSRVRLVVVSLPGTPD